MLTFVAYVSGFFVALLGFAFVVSPEPDVSISRRLFLATGAIVAMIFLAFIGEKGRRILLIEAVRGTKSIEASLELDGRAPVILLRSFASGVGLLAQPGDRLFGLGREVSGLERLTAFFERVGPFLTLVKPGGGVVPGPGQTLVMGNWRGYIQDLLSEASAVVIYAGSPGGGLGWEVDLIVRDFPARKVCVVFDRDRKNLEAFDAEWKRATGRTVLAFSDWRYRAGRLTPLISTRENRILGYVLFDSEWCAKVSFRQPGKRLLRHMGLRARRLPAGSERRGCLFVGWGTVGLVFIALGILALVGGEWLAAACLVVFGALGQAAPYVLVAWGSKRRRRVITELADRQRSN